MGEEEQDEDEDLASVHMYGRRTGGLGRPEGPHAGTDRELTQNEEDQVRETASWYNDGLC